MKRNRPLFVLVCITVFVTTAFAHFGARFEPPDGTILHGCGWDGYDSQALYNGMFPANHHPLVLQVVTSIPGTRGTDINRVVQAFTDPIVHPDSQYIEYGVHFSDREGMLDSVFALTTEMDGYIDTLAQAMLQVNRPFFLRIGFEFNGYWNPYHPYIFPLAFRKLVIQLRARGVNNFATVWCYEPDAPGDFADSTAQGWKWYPGDDVVDWCGLDPFDVEHFDPSLPDSSRGELTEKGKSEAFLRFAVQRRKPVYLNELSARNVFIVPDSLDPNQTQGQQDWNYWFVPFFQFVNNHPEIKGWNYINLDWTHYETYATWGDARLEINSYIRTRWVDSLMTPRFLNAGYDITQQVYVPEPANNKPETYSITAAPNPFNATTTIEYTIPAVGKVELKVFDITGREVATLVDFHQNPGIYKAIFDGTALSTGTYFIRLQSGNFSNTRKTVLLK